MLLYCRGCAGQERLAVVEKRPRQRALVAAAATSAGGAGAGEVLK